MCAASSLCCPVFVNGQPGATDRARAGGVPPEMSRHSRVDETGNEAHRGLVKSRSALTLVISLLSASVATPTLAADEVSLPTTAEAARRRKEAEQHYDRAVQLHEDGNLKLALVEFRRAYELDSSWQVLFNIGTVHFQLGHYADARAAYERYLAEGTASIGVKRREFVEKELAALAIRTTYLARG